MTSAQRGDQGERPWWRRALRVLVLAIFWPLAFAATLLASTILHLDSAPARRELCGRVEPLMDDALQGEFEMECVEISPRRIEVADFVARDSEGVEVLRVPRVSIDISRSDLFFARLVVERVHITDPYASLERDPRTGELRIAEAFTPVEPSPEEPAAERPNIPHIVVEAVLIEGGRVDHLSPTLDARGVRLDAEGVVDDRIDVTIHDLDAELVRHDDGTVVASIERLDGEAAFLEPGAETAIELRIDGMGADYVAGTAGMTWGEAIPEVFTTDLDFHASPETFAAAGLPEVSGILEAPVSGHLTANGDLDQGFEANAELSTAGGELQVTAELTQELRRIDAQVQTEGLDLAEVLVPVEEGRFAGTLDVELHPPGEDGRRRIVVDGQALEYTAADGNAYQAPALHAAAFLGDDHVEILELDVPHLEGESGHLDVTGRVGFDGSVDVAVDAQLPDLGADPNLAQLIDGPMGGGVTVDARVRLDPDDDFAIEADGRVAGRNLRLPWLTAERLDVRGRVHGRAPAPRANVEVEARNLRAGDLTVARAEVHIEGGSADGGAGRYRIVGDVNGSLPEANADSTVDLVAVVDESGVTLDGTAEVRGLWSTPITAELDQVRYEPDRGLRVENVQVHSADGMGVTASGVLDLSGDRSDAHLRLRDVDLEKIAERFDLEQLDLRGTASAEVDFRGSMRHPILTTAGRVESFQIAGVSFEELKWAVNVEDEGRASIIVVRASVESEGNGRAELDARGRVQGPNPLQKIAQAYWDATLTTEELRVGLLPEVIEGFPAVDGRVDTRVVLDGTIGEPERLALAMVVRELSVPGFTEVDLDVEGELTGHELTFASTVAYPSGSDQVLLGAEATAGGFELLEVATSDAPLAFLADPWTLAIDIPERPVSELPAPLAFSSPMRAALHARFSGGGGESGAQGLDGALENARGQVEGWARYDEDAQAGCAEGRPELTLRATLEDGKTELRAVGQIGGEQNLLVEASAATPIGEWARRPPETIPAVLLTALAEGLPLHSVPYVCQFAEGELSLDIEGRDLFTETPTVSLEAAIADFSIAESEPVRFHIEGALDSQRARVQAEMRADQRVAFRLRAEAPTRWGGETLVPALREDARWEARAEFDRAPIAPLLAAVPIVAEPVGTLDGRVHASGLGTDIQAGGRLQMNQVGFVLRQPYVRVEDLNGGVRLDDEGLRIEDIRFSDRGGVARIDGRILRDGWRPDSAQLTIRTDDFPMRVEGVIYAYVDTHTEVNADFDPERNLITVAMDRTSVRLPADLGRSLQPLAQHDDVIYEDQPGYDPNDPIEMPTDEVVGDSVFADETLVRVRSEPFWVRRDDFSVQVRPRVDIWITPDGVRLSGPVQIRRGYIAFMGKQFDFKRGEVRFTGGNTIDPQVDIEAHHDIGGGETITAHISGQLLRPELDFTSSRDASISNSEAIQLLVRGRAGASSETASQQAASFLTGMFAGVLSSVTRREIGEYVPIFGISSQGGATTLRVGFQADQLIPDALDDVILGAYVEGYVGGGANDGNQAGGSAVTGGAVIEFVLPRDLVWTGTYDIPTNWSTDLMWEP